MIKTISVKEYAKQKGKTKEAIFYQIKKGKIKAQKNSSNEWEILLEEKQEPKPKVNNKNVELEHQIKLLSKELELKDELLTSKETIILRHQLNSQIKKLLHKQSFHA
jgi:aspartyl-tRNA synthetase